ncbi:hypothetical protein KC347_g8423 [Hortaea werneckii]|nr:hypothetical protein KC347_g8423 [Hortaea werneckii]
MHLQATLGLVGASISLVTALVCPSIASNSLNATELAVPIQARDSPLPYCQADPWGQNPQWANADNDGRGKFLGSCSHHDQGKKRCWTDVYLVASQWQYKRYEQVSDPVHCVKSGSCTINKINAIQDCTSWAVGVGETAGIDFAGISIGGSLTQTSTSGTCQTSTDSYTCSWTDTNCHRITARSKYVRNVGYARRSCNSAMGKDIKPRAGDGKFTLGWLDWSADIPTANSWEYSCKNRCETDLATKGGEVGPMNYA